MGLSNDSLTLCNNNIEDNREENLDEEEEYMPVL
jgi:hypothetical protein